MLTSTFNTMTEIESRLLQIFVRKDVKNHISTPRSTKSTRYQGSEYGECLLLRVNLFFQLGKTLVSCTSVSAG